MKFLVLLIITLCCMPLCTIAQTTQFTYQGRFTDTTVAQPTNGTYEMQFTVFDAVTNGNPSGAMITLPTVQVVNGIFTVVLDFTQATFSGADRYIEITVRPSGSSDQPVTLMPRQQVTSAPFAIQSLNAGNALIADNSLNLGGFAANTYIQTGDSRLSDSRNPLAGSPNYIQNSTSLQPLSNFNVSGNGIIAGNLTANIVNSITNFRIGNIPVFSTPNQTSVVAGQSSNYTLAGATSTFIGYKSGAAANGFSQANTFIGSEAGETTTSGSNNVFVGKDSGIFNSSGSFNSFFGSNAGLSNTTANANSFFGYESGLINTLGTRNSYFGFQSGRNNQLATDNSFFGYQSGNANIGTKNAFFGSLAGSANTSGNQNTFVGSKAGSTNISGTSNTLIGYNSDSTGDGNTVVGANAGTTSGINNTIVGLNSFTDGGDNNTIIGYNARVSAVTPRSHSTAIGADAVVNTSDTIVLGISSDDVEIPGNLRVSKVVNANILAGNSLNVSTINATGQIKTVLMLGGATQVCRNAQNILSSCSSSLRYKTNIAKYSGGLNLLNRLNPITFDWKDGGMHDLGFGAEDVAEVDPLLVTYNDSGQIEGVKYDRITTILVNSVKEQQTQIAVQAEQIKHQQTQIEALKQIVCSQNPTVDICQKEK